MTIKKLVYLLNTILEDLFMFAGLFILVWTTYSLTTIGGNYTLGIVLLGFGWLLSRRR